MFIKRGPRPEKYSICDQKVIGDRELSHGACRLYCLLVGLREGRNISDLYLMKTFEITSQTLYNWKGELKKRELIHIERIGPRIYQLYTGTSKISAKQVFETLTSEDLVNE